MPRKRKRLASTHFQTLGSRTQRRILNVQRERESSSDDYNTDNTDSEDYAQDRSRHFLPQTHVKCLLKGSEY